MEVNYLFRNTIWGIFFVLSIKEILNYWFAKKSEKWSRHKATISDVKIDVKTHRDTDDEGYVSNEVQYSMAFVHYKYQYSGKEYLSKKMQLSNDWSVDYGDSSSAVIGINPGDEITIYVNPKKPKQSVLIRGYKNNGLKELAVISLFLLVVEIFAM